jgi:hypothetical protein
LKDKVLQFEKAFNLNEVFDKLLKREQRLGNQFKENQ